MIGLLALLASMSFVSSDKGPSWQTAVDRLALHAALIRNLKGSEEDRSLRIELLLKKLNLAPRVDAKASKRTGGFFLYSGDAVIPIQGTKNGTMLFLMRGPDPQDDPESGGYAVLIEKQGKKKGYAVDVAKNPYDDMIYPESAALFSDKLVIVGRFAWLGTGPALEVRSYQLKANRFRLVAKLNSPNEMVTMPRLLLSKDGKRAEPITFKGRTFPNNLSVGHNDAQRTYDEKWGFRSGKPYVISRKLCETPFNALDELVGAVRKNGKSKIRYRSLNRRIYQQLVAFRAQGMLYETGIRYPKGQDPNRTHAFGLTSIDSTLHFKLLRGRWVVWKIGPISECQPWFD